MTTPPDYLLTSLWAVLVPVVLLFILYAARQLYTALTQTHEQQVRTQAHRLMLRFCKNPTQHHFEQAWAFLEDNDVWVSELDQPLVRRFHGMAEKMAVSRSVE